VRTMRISIDRLTALDQLMLRASTAWPQDIGALALLDGANLLEPSGRLRIEAVREAIESRLPLVPRFRQVVYVPRRGLGGPLWVDAPSFELSDHLRVLPLPAGSGEADLLVAIERLRRQPLDAARPLWELWFLTGLPNTQVALFVRLHHAIADGMAAMTIVAALLDPAPDAPAAPAPPWTPTPRPSARRLLADNLRRHLQRLASALSVLARPRTTLQRLRAAWPAIRELFAETPAPETSLDRMVGPGRTLALIRTTLDQVKQVAQMAVPLPLEVSEPGRRLHQIAAETAKRKARTRTSLGTLFRGRIARLLLLKAVMRQRVNVTSASIPGPQAPLYLAGARLLEVFPVLPLIANEPLGVGALSYAGTFTIGVVADRDAFPDIEVFAAGAREELRALGVSTCPTSGRPGADALGARPTRDGRPAGDADDNRAVVAQPLVLSEGEMVTHDNAQC
jgi:diacylglycerol O-acyltransferase / wax synthase